MPKIKPVSAKTFIQFGPCYTDERIYKIWNNKLLCVHDINKLKDVPPEDKRWAILNMCPKKSLEKFHKYVINKLKKNIFMDCCYYSEEYLVDPLNLFEMCESLEYASIDFYKTTELMLKKLMQCIREYEST